MPKTKISEYSATANSNTDVASINIDEGCAPSGINNAIRALMAQLKDFQTGAASDPVTVGGVLTVTGGSASAPAITTSGDTNTGVLFPAADTVGITTGGTERVRVDSSGNVGVGTSSPLGKVGIQGPTQRMGFNVGTLASPNAGNLFYETDGTGWDFRIGKYQSGSFTAQMTLADSGNVGIGTSTPSGALGLYRGASISCMIEIAGNANTPGSTSMLVGQDATSSGYCWNRANSVLLFGTNNTERMRIDSSGNLLVGTTSTNPTNGGMSLLAIGAIQTSRATTSTAGQMEFRNPNGIVGTIQTTGSSTAYNTSSDYRLKENIQPMTGALVKVAAMKPCTYKWKVDGSDGEGFIAHELQSVVPHCVTGEKDAVDSEGKPVYQGIDTSFLVATLTAAIQELKATVDAQAARITALEQA